jgi:hypothetical protein
MADSGAAGELVPSVLRRAIDKRASWQEMLRDPAR